MQPAQAVRSDDGTWKVIIIEQAIDEPDAIAFAEAEGTMAERDAYAERSSDYQSVIEEYREAVYEAERIGTLLKGAELTIEVWRTQNANNRRGHV